MTRKEQALILGFVEYLQSIYGEDGTQPLAAIPNTPPNALLIPMFAGSEPDDMQGVDLGALGGALGQEPDVGQLLSRFDAMTGMG